MPTQLSGGQQQRIALARALVGRPRSDEPTGTRDSRSGQEVMTLIRELHGQGMTVVVVAHDASVAGYCRRLVHVRDGVVEREETGC